MEWINHCEVLLWKLLPNRSYLVACTFLFFFLIQEITWTCFVYHSQQIHLICEHTEDSNNNPLMLLYTLWYKRLNYSSENARYQDLYSLPWNRVVILLRGSCLLKNYIFPAPHAFRWSQAIEIWPSEGRQKWCRPHSDLVQVNLHSFSYLLNGYQYSGWPWQPMVKGSE